MMDLVMRLRLALLAAGLEDNNENRNRLIRPVLRQLIDESLQLQEAARLDLAPLEEDVRNAFATLAQQNNLSPENFVELLQARGILPAAIMDQVRATLTWQMLIDRRLRRRIEVSEEDVELAFDQRMDRQSQRQSRVLELFIGFDRPEDEPEALATIEKLREQLQAGTPFPAIATQFSQSASAARGGDLGWIVAGELPQELDSVLARMGPGELSPPIRSFGGYYLIAVRNVRQGGAQPEERLRIARVVLPLQAGSDIAQEAGRIEQATRQLNSCEAASRIGDILPGAELTVAERVSPSSFPPDLRSMLGNLAIEQPSPVIQTPEGLVVLMICERRQGEGLSKERVERELEREQLNTLIRRYMRDLRRTANVDIRL